jgi:hypothetical protein
VRCGVGDLRLEAASGERGSGSFKVGAVGWALEIEIWWAGVRESECRAHGWDLPSVVRGCVVLSRRGFEFGETALQLGVLQAQTGRFAACGGGFLSECREQIPKLL